MTRTDTDVVARGVSFAAAFLCGWTVAVVGCLLVSSVACAQQRQPPPDLTRAPPRVPLILEQHPVQWGLAIDQALGQAPAITLPGRVRTDRGPVAFDQPLIVVRFAENVSFGDGSQRTRVHYTDYSTAILESCSQDTAEPGCQLSDWVASARVAIAARVAPTVHQWDAVILVLTVASGCREAIAVVGPQVESYTVGHDPADAQRVRLHFRNAGPVIRTCTSEDALLLAANGVY